MDFFILKKQNFYDIIFLYLKNNSKAMVKKFFFLLAIFGGIFLCPKIVKAADFSVMINEVAWMSTSSTDPTSEWLELYNQASSSVDLTGWVLKATDDSPEISLDGLIAGQGFFLLERTDDDSVSGVLADQIYTGLLKNSGEVLELYDSQGNLVERLDCSSGWFAGDNETKRTMSRLSPGQSADWADSAETGGTPGAVNDFFIPPPNQPPTAEAGSDQSGLVNQEFFFDGGDSGDSDGEIVEYYWDFGDGGSAEGKNVSHYYADPGNFLVSLDVFDDDGACDNDQLVVVVSDDFGSASSSDSVLPSEIVINEFVSDAPADSREWLELYSQASSSVDLINWTIEDNIGLILNLTGEITPGSFLVFEIDSNKLNNSGDIIVLKNDQGEIIDQVSYGNYGETPEDNAPAVNDPNSVARKVDGQDSGNDGEDFAETITPTKGGPNEITVESPDELEEKPSGSSSGSAPEALPSFSPGDLVINEFVSDPTDDSTEWLELYNRTAKTIVLTNWTIEEGSETVTSLSGSFGPGEFALIEKPRGNLNNSGDLIILKDPSGQEIDRVVYGRWDDGELADNAPNPGDPNSAARKVDGGDSDNSYQDFSLTVSPTPGAANLISTPTEESADSSRFQASYSSEIIINEFFPNPAGSDQEGEFIELKNIGDQPVDVAGWKLGDNSQHRYTLKAGDSGGLIIAPGGFLTVSRRESGLALNNTGNEAVKLFWPNSVLTDEIGYSGQVLEDYSRARRQDGQWFWTKEITPGRENIIIQSNQPPAAVFSLSASRAEINQEIVFDASDSLDPEQGPLEYYWDFGDGAIGSQAVVSHRYSVPGSYRVVLTVIDDCQEEAVARQEIEVGLTGIEDYSAVQVFISEFLPNPEGPDTVGEFIELFNPNDFSVDLTGWRLDDCEGGSRPWKISGVILVPGGYAAVFRDESGLALNNDGDTVRLFNPQGDLVDRIDYSESFQGASYAFDDQAGWRWTARSTIGRKNIFQPLESNAGLSGFQKISLSEIREFEKGTKIKVVGTVAAVPGVLGDQIFYLVADDFPEDSVVCRAGIQVYSHQKDFPDLQAGDRLEVSGVISSNRGEARLKISAKESIRILGRGEEPTAQEKTIREIGEDCEGNLVKVSGEVVEIRGRSIYLDDDSAELRIYLKQSAEISELDIEEADRLAAVGIVSETKSGYRILPRRRADLVKSKIKGAMAVRRPSSEFEFTLTTKYLLGVIVFMAGIIGWLAQRLAKLKKVV